MLTGSRTRVALATMIVLAVAALGSYFALRGDKLAHRFIPGQRLVYRFECLSASAANLSVLTRGADQTGAKKEQTVFTNVEADLHTTVLKVTGDEILIACVLRNPEVQVVFDGELAISQAEAIQTDLSRTVLAVLDRQGRIRSVHLDPKVSSLSHSFVRAILASTQVVLPDDAAQTVWEQRESDPNGEYFARYKLATNDGEESIATILKERTRYLPRSRENSIRKLDVVSVARPSGSMTVRFDQAAGHVRSITGSEETSILVDEKMVAKAETTLRMHFRTREMVPAAEMEKLHRLCAALQETAAVTLSAPAPMAERESSIHRNELGDATLESLLGELAQLEAKNDPNAADTSLYLKLKALAYLQPEACLHLGKLLSAAKSESRTIQLLTGVLSSVGHADAQIALQVAIRVRSTDEETLAMLVSALAMVETPTVASEETLRQLTVTSPFVNIRASAELGLGTMAHQLAPTQPERTARIVRAMTAKLAKAEDADTRRHCLFVLGNAGSIASLDVIKGYIGDTAPEVRAAAAAALRWLDVSEADRLLCNALAADTDTTVRIEAATAMCFRQLTASAFAAQKTAFLEDISVNVRLAVMPSLARSVEGRALLTEAQNDPVKEIREEAANVLANQ